MASLETVRTTVPQPVAKEIWHRTLSADAASGTPCPVCTRSMTEVPLQFGSATGYLDVCKQCRFIWFDPHEYEDLPTKPGDTAAEPIELPAPAKEALAMARLEALREERDQEMVDSPPDNWWELALGYCGMPVEYNNTDLRYSPFVTWALAATIFVVTLASFSNQKDAVTNWGLIPGMLTRHYGLTFISSFFLHGGILHMIGNLYFLLIFGDNVEDVLGRPWYILLLAVAALVGDFAHIMIDPASQTPVIGASGAISGIMVYYALRFPKARMGFLMWFKWFRMPVGWMLVFWVLSQVYGVVRQISGFGNVSAAAHLGGALTGLLFWWATRPEKTETDYAL